MVQAGQPMFQQDAKPFQAQLDAAKGRARRTAGAAADGQRQPGAGRRWQRSRRWSQGKELDDATGQQQAPAAGADGDGQRRDGKAEPVYTRITSPVSGLSSFARVQDGAYVNAENSLLTYVEQVDPVWSTSRCPRTELLAVRSEQKAGASSCRQQGRVRRRAGARRRERTGRRAASLSPMPTTTRRPAPSCCARRCPTPRVRCGQGSSSACACWAQQPGAILVPQQSVLQGATGHFVILVDKDGKAQLRNVEVGPWLGNDWFINSGLQAGDVVVTDGMARLSPGAAVKVVEARPGRPPPSRFARGTAASAAARRRQPRPRRSKPGAPRRVLALLHRPADLLPCSR